jgi:hypothetical protein
MRRIFRLSPVFQAAVAYISSDALELLPLNKGVTLVVDMSDRTVRNGSTNPAMIRRYLERGVAVYSLPGLHAKVFAFDRTAVIGSTNVSAHSRERLTEAAVLTTDSDVVKSCRQFIQELAEGVDLVTDEDVERCEAIYTKPRWLPGDGIPPRATKDRWEYQVMAALGKPPRSRPRHGYFVDLKNFSSAVGTAYLRLDPAPRGIGAARLNLYPADVIQQAKSFYPEVETSRLLRLAGNGWRIRANLHFGNSYGLGLPPHVEKSPIGLSKYIEFWKSNQDSMRRFDRPVLMREIKKLQDQRVIPRDLPRNELKALRRFKRVDIRPGMSLTFVWPAFKKLPDPIKFAPRVRQRIDEALKTWNDSF